MNVKPLTNALTKTTKAISKETKQTVKKALNNVKHEKFINKNFPRVSPKQGQIDRLNKIQNPNSNAFKSIVGESPSEFVEQAAVEGEARRATVEAYEQRVANMADPNAKPFVGLEEQGRLAKERTKLSEVGNIVEDEEQAMQVEAAAQAKLKAESEAVKLQAEAAKSEQLNSKLSNAAEDITIEPVTASTKQPKPELRSNNAFDESMLIADDVVVAKPTQDYLRKEGIVPEYGFDYEQEGFKTNIDSNKPLKLDNMDDLVRSRRAYKGNGTIITPGYVNQSDTESSWSSTAKAALGTAVVGAGICAALSSSRGQQNNAQLYGQQPIY